jgi:hypothetical protein
MTIRRWIRSGRFFSRKAGTQHFVDERELKADAGDEGAMLPLPREWDVEPRIDWARLLRDDRGRH